VTDGPVEDGARQRAATEAPEHQPEVHRAAVGLLGVDGQYHGEEGQDEEVGDDSDAKHPEDEPVAADEGYALREFGEVPASTSKLCADRAGLQVDRRKQRRDQGRRDGERCRVYPQHVARREQGYQNARKRRAQQERGVLDTLEGRIGPFYAHPGPPCEVGDEALAGRVARRVEETAEKDQHEKLPEGQPGRVVEQGYQRHRHRTCEVGNDAGPLEAQAVHDRPADDTSHDGRKQEGPADEPSLGGAACGLQDEPGDGHKRQNVPGLGDRVGSEQGQDGSAPRRSGSARRIVHRLSPYHPLGKRRV
jgi:hypothetical protein